MCWKLKQMWCLLLFLVVCWKLLPVHIGWLSAVVMKSVSEIRGAILAWRPAMCLSHFPFSSVSSSFFSDTQFLFIFQPEKRKANTAGTAPCQSTSSTFSTLLNLSALMRGDAKVFVSVHIYIHIVEFCQEWQRVRDWNESKPKEKRISKK